MLLLSLRSVVNLRIAFLVIVQIPMTKLLAKVMTAVKGGPIFL